MVGNAGVIEAEVVLVSKKSENDDVRWVYLDIGKFGGLAETMDESIRYPIRTPRDGDDVGPCVLAGPTCDSADVLYEKEPYELPVSLEIGDKVLIEGTGAYTATYAAVAFNGFAPLRTLPHLTLAPAPVRRRSRPPAPVMRIQRDKRTLRCEGGSAMVTIRKETLFDAAAREALLDEAFGRARFTKTSARLREGRLPADGLVIRRGRARPARRHRAALARLAPGRGGRRSCSGRSPSPAHCRNRGIGATLMRRAIARGASAGHRAILLVGDAAYYGRFGFTAETTGALWMPGRFERERLLALELRCRARSTARAG